MTMLAGRRALVTGATRGIGRAIAERLVLEGAQVTVTGTRQGFAAPSGVEYIAVDFTDQAALARFADGVRAAEYDILINNAGINKISPFAEIDPADFARVQQVNVTAPFLLAHASIPSMVARGWGRIVNITSVWGKVGRAERGPYATSKFALDGMSVALAAEVAARGILVNCVAPGIVDTELTRRVLGEDGIRRLVEEIPIGRLATADEIAAVVVWLASPENTYISGQNISVDGGLSRV